MKEDRYTPIAKAALQNMLSAIHEAEALYPDLDDFGGCGRAVVQVPATRGEAKALLLSQPQAEALEEIQALCWNMLRLAQQVNVLGVAFRFMLPTLILPEVGQVLSEIDGLVFNSKWVSRRLGVTEVVPDTSLVRS